MRLSPAAPRAGWRLALAAAVGLVLPSLVAADDKPKVVTTKFDYMPRGVQYFEDSDVVLFQDFIQNTVYRSPDAGQTWKAIDSVPGGEAWEVTLHPYDHMRAYILTNDDHHWMTTNRGESWSKFEVPLEPMDMRRALAFHASDPDKIIFNGGECLDIFCTEMSYYTTDNFKSAKKLRGDTHGCSWAKSSDIFSTGDAELDKKRILCVVKGPFSWATTDFRLVMSDKYFEEEGDVLAEFEPQLEADRSVNGIVNIAIVKRYLVAAAMAEHTSEMALYVSDDTITWHRAMFPHDHRMDEGGYTILESTNYSIQIDVMTTRPDNPMGVLLSSNSNGTYFTRNIEHTNRNMNGFVDFEKISGVQGIVMVNAVKNWEGVEESSKTDKKLVSKISFDDGRTFVDLTVDSHKKLHLHSVTNIHNVGRIFSSPAPGLVMGVGNTGDFLEKYGDGNLYVSDNAGLIWRKALDGPHKYEFGDQGSILVAIHEGPTKKLKYSTNHGKDWESFELPEEVSPVVLTTTQDSTSLKFMLVAQSKDEKFVIMAIDFGALKKRDCKKDDMEKWYARVDGDHNPTCLMGHRQFYMRRKADANCFINDQDFHEELPQFEACECTDADFECDYNFVRSDDRMECVQEGRLIVPDGKCKNSDSKSTFMGSSGWRLIPGNECKRKDGKQKDDPVERKCADAVGAPATGLLQDHKTSFDGKTFMQKIYLERTETSSGDDETILTWTDKNQVYVSEDHGKNWEEILTRTDITAIVPHPYVNDMVFFLTKGKDVYYTVNRLKSITKFEAPHPYRPDNGIPLRFHPDPRHKDWMIWLGADNCESGSTDCHVVASSTQDRGDNWRTLERYVGKCEFMAGIDTPHYKRDDQLIYCTTRKREDNEGDNPMQLVSSTNWFDDRAVHFESIEDFATMAEFIIVAAKTEDNYLHVDASVDGTTFAEAMFPPNFKVEHQQAYTVLDSSTHAVFLHVTVENRDDFEYGSLIKSNSNGTSYVKSIDGVNRDSTGYVDFEKLYGLEGVALVNVVANLDAKAEPKKLKSMISHNDGAEWDYLTPPEKDVDGKKWKCSGSLEKCSLNIHGYTERVDKSRTYSQASAVGLAMATGNVGEFLAGKDEVSTFITRDAGISWLEVKKGAYMWEFGDQGAFIAIIRQKEPTNSISYSLDEGTTWKDFRFYPEEIAIDDITTVPSANSRNILLWGRDKEGLVTINIDFSGLTDHQCSLDEQNTEDGDYYLWTPKHPKMADDCLFGHVSQYHRKRVDANCYNGRTIQHLHNIARNCSCTRQDFECDFNFQRLNDGSCALVPGLEPQDHSQICSDDGVNEYYDPTGYRRIPLSTCQGGQEMEYTSTVHPCPGKEKEFNERHGISGAALFFAIVLPIAAAAGVGYWVYQNWEGKFGQIRLGEQRSMEDQPYIKYPVMAVAGVVSVLQSLPLLASSLWRTINTAIGRSQTRRFTTRSSFARGRGDYAVVDDDEGELLGDESDEDV